MPGILRWGEFRGRFNEGLDAGNCVRLSEMVEVAIDIAIRHGSDGREYIMELKSLQILTLVFAMCAALVIPSVALAQQQTTRKVPKAQMDLPLSCAS